MFFTTADIDLKLEDNDLVFSDFWHVIEQLHAWKLVFRSPRPNFKNLEHEIENFCVANFFGLTNQIPCNYSVLI